MDPGKQAFWGGRDSGGDAPDSSAPSLKHQPRITNHSRTDEIEVRDLA
jgi:hypothetical protein